MSETTALAVTSLQDTLTLGKVLAESGFFSDARQASQAVAKVLTGRELGLGPMASMMGVNIVQGKPSLAANLQAALVKGSGRYDYRIKTLTDKQCTLVFYERGEAVGESTFTLEDAERAKLLVKDVWKSYPRNLLFARAISNGIKWFCPNVTNGLAVYTPEELGQPVDGDVVDVQPVVKAEPPKPATTPEPVPAATKEKKSVATNGKGFRIVTSRWQEVAGNLAAKVTYYQAADGTPDWYHMAGAAKKLGFDHVGEDNLDLVIDALTSYAKEHATASQPEPTTEPAA